ncbi:MAG: hypothetical protein EHM72_12400 [Calditrichaeota bacterium]|nr:MAG: hypothetical protein EHM72_12400 [Calditrichota bacterium]
MKKIVAFGEILWDMFQHKRTLGGAPFNFAYRVKSLGDEALFISRVGEDQLGRDALTHMTKLGLDSSWVQQDGNHPTGTVEITLDDQGTPEYQIKKPVAFDFIHFHDSFVNALHQAECLYFGTLIQRNEISRNCLRQLLQLAPTAVRLVDLNLRQDCYNNNTILYSLEQANILKLNEIEAQWLCRWRGVSITSLPRFCTFALSDWRLDYVVVTLGEYGVFAQSQFGEEVYVPGYRVKMVDSVGAGDAFAAAFIHQLLRGESLRSACELGNAVGALVCATSGAAEFISPVSIQQMIKSQAERIYHSQFAR